MTLHTVSFKLKFWLLLSFSKLFDWVFSLSLFCYIFLQFILLFLFYFRYFYLFLHEPKFLFSQKLFRRPFVRCYSINLLWGRPAGFKQCSGPEENLPALQSAVVLARPLASRTWHAPQQDRLRHVQVLLQDVPEQELAGLPHVEVSQRCQRPTGRSGGWAAGWNPSGSERGPRVHLVDELVRRCKKCKSCRARFNATPITSSCVY